ncbi:tetratricopeptide repeat protein [Haliangium ochraceum]|uniref:Tetratricopeptide TPR_2 repeat protein n=1 Tax=Haliangium ochraceum (strain DSM 14365 / JCM 11303 / SMP-2) TaxID=502025 RepID=D0LY79_HALO1|nr:tetratricopeptide repeat protein [Haliangium ochraceum]ACY16229.1 Tetratricopeptide TPR_2 repeat protein [Haliangium ochraceum DSM 14365]
MSPKNKGNFGKGKSAVELEDDFVTGVSNVAEKIQPHLKTIAVLVSAALLLAIVWFAYDYTRTRAEIQATSMYREALAAADRAVVPAAEEGEDAGNTEEPAADPAVDPLAEPEEITYPSYEARAQAVVTQLDALFDKHGSTDTARAARVTYAAALYDSGRYADAATAYQELLDDASVSPAIADLARTGLGYALEGAALASEEEGSRTAGLEKALASFRQIQTDDAGPKREFALYHEARILTKLGKRDEALAALEKALEIAPDSPLRSDIRLRIVQLSE